MSKQTKRKKRQSNSIYSPMRLASLYFVCSILNRQVLSKKLIIIDDENHQTATQSNFSFLFRISLSLSLFPLLFKEALRENHHQKWSNLQGN